MDEHKKAIPVCNFITVATFSLRVHSARKWTIVMTLANERVCYLRQRLTDYFALVY